ncbi:hypothetical protein ACFLYQ_00730 [Chloroflexota bacterium]
MLITFEDQVEMVQKQALVTGAPNIRFLYASRTIPGQEGIDTFLEPLIAGLTEPLTEEEKESGRWEPPTQDRVIFEGTMDEAEDFFNQTHNVFWASRAPINMYTDGLPIVLPTEERVKKMLKATSHKPDEMITLQSDRPGFGPMARKKGQVVEFGPMNWTATVETIAVNAVMAGCKPEYFPIVLAIAESGCGTGTTVFWSQWQVISGPIAKEIGMNAGTAMLDPGSRANATIGRAYQLISINVGGAVPGINRMNSIGSPFNTGGTCFAENADGLPPGWLGINEEYGYDKNDNVVMVMNTGGGISGGEFSPGGYRALQKMGHGGVARRMGVRNQPGPHNWMEYLLPGIWANREGSRTFIMAPQMAADLHKIGFKSKDDVYQWIYDNAKVPVKDYKLYSWQDMYTGGGMAKERTSGKRWKELEDDYMVPVMGDNPRDNCIIIGGGPEEVCLSLGGRSAMMNPIYSIDAWK